MCGGGGLLDQGGILLRDVVHADNGRVDLLDAGALFDRGRHHFTHDGAHARDRLRDFGHGASRFLYGDRADIDVGCRPHDQAAYLLRRRGAALCQRTHFAGDHRKATPLLTCARRFHGCIEREDIGLESDAFNRAVSPPSCVCCHRTPCSSRQEPVARLHRRYSSCAMPLPPRPGLAARCCCCCRWWK